MMLPADKYTYIERKMYLYMCVNNIHSNTLMEDTTQPPFFEKVTELRAIPELAPYNIPEGYVLGTTNVTPDMFDTKLIGYCSQLAHERMQFWKSKGYEHVRVLNMRPFIPNTDNLADVKGNPNGTNATHTVVELQKGVIVKEGVPHPARLIDDPTYCANRPPMCIHEYAENLAKAVYELDDGVCTHVREWTTGYHGELAL
jgi:hypothetical protein